MTNQMQRVVNNIEVGSGILEIERNGNAYTFEVSEEGGTFSFARDIDFIEVDESVGRVDAYIVGEEANFSLDSLEMDVELLREAIGHGVIETVEIDGVYEQVLTFGGSADINVSKLTYTVPRRKNRDLNIIIELHRVISATDMEEQHTKTDPTSYPVVFEAMNDLDKDAGKRLGKITVEVDDGEDIDLANLLVTIDEQQSDDDVIQGNTLTVVSDIENTGEVESTQEITLDFDGDGTVNDTEVITLQGGVSQEVTHEYSVPADATTGMTDVVVASDDDSDTYQVEVLAS